jgi:type II secretory pathway pseudopilin PulG
MPSPSWTAPPPELVTPGPAGFIVIALLAVALVFLAADMLRRVRRARYRDEANATLDAEQAAAEAAAQGDAAAEASAVDDQDIDPADDDRK